nr:MAG TPA: hypothetical protein [Caudoviricetes sp.]
MTGILYLITYIIKLYLIKILQVLLILIHTLKI